MQKVIFKKEVSKGTKFNQIYVPKKFANKINPGDLVEVRLVKKNVNLISNIELTPFKKELIKKIFIFLQNIDIEQIFVVGSFLTKKIDYADIDIVLVSENASESFDERVYEKLIEKFNLKFHVLSIKKENFENLLRICPLTNAMLDKFVSNKQFKKKDQKEIDKNHIKRLLMMPEDLLDLDLNSRAFYDGLRRLTTIELFLEKKKSSCYIIEKKLRFLLGNLFEMMKNNEVIDKIKLTDIRKILKNKLNKINKILNE